ncbi:Ysc84 actin-binding domain-containing protein [Cynara cardunculus var. scolymus]|uniref:Ysc84 actin-binding domain-containing protein n=1 Tax=Cynara cardunculus var. scolymus TaxID=59895 RepID=A0A103Y450_CYNCS|nr:Ysc84 actin-binding domain-containing protein [Cynara cardunculus var. scolymus]
MDQPDVVRYPLIHLHDYEPKIFPPKGSEGVNEYSNGGGSCDPRTEEMPVLEAKKTKTIVGSRVGSDTHEDSNDDHEKKESENFYYDPPITEDTGVWIPVSVPPMSESQREEWNRGIRMNTNYIRDVDMDWDQFVAEDKELTMWDVVLDMLLAAGGRVRSITSGDSYAYQISWLSDQLLEHTWKEVSHNLTEVNAGGIRELLEADPPKWLADSAAAYCMLCNVRFHPIMCSRHHCRFCGGIFCNECSKGRSLLPIKFRHENPQRVCDVCCVRLESIQPYLMEQVSRAVQVPTQDVTDLSTLRSWLNFPWGQTMEYEIYKAANTIHGYFKVGSLSPEKAIPNSILKKAKGLAILTVAKVGMMVTYNVGTGLVVARREDGSWSPPSAISSFGMGWGAQVGGEVMDFIIVLRNSDAVKTFGGNAHLSVGAGASAAAGIVGRAAEADFRAGDGAFVGCSVEGSIVTTRTQENCRFYGNPSIKTSDILLGSLPRPPAAAILYDALSKLYMKVGRR